MYTYIYNIYLLLMFNIYIILSVLYCDVSFFTVIIRPKMPKYVLPSTSNLLKQAKKKSIYSF